MGRSIFLTGRDISRDQLQGKCRVHFDYLGIRYVCDIYKNQILPEKKMMIYLNQNVRLRFINDIFLDVIKTVYDIFSSYSQNTVITSGCDGKHMLGSYHYDGWAWDFRYRVFQGSRIPYEAVRKRLKELSSYYDTDLDLTKGNEHMHIEYDLRREARDDDTRKNQIQEEQEMTELQIPKHNSVSWEWLGKLLRVVLAPLIPIITKQIRDMIQDNVKTWWEKAKATENPWDDFLVQFIAGFLKIDLD